MPSVSSRRKSRWLIFSLVAIGSLALVAGGVWWWQNRPIQPVKLSAEEKAVVEAKVEAIQDTDGPVYVKGSKEIILTERELNGLLNENTNLGKSLRFELARDAIHARVETDLDPDLPIVGGKRLKARARFLISEDHDKPAFTLDDVTVWGVSLPNDWLGGLKGIDLLKDTLGVKRGTIAGIEEFKAEPGRLIIRLAE